MVGQHNPQLIENLLKFFRPVLRHVFRAKVSGVEKIAPGAYLFVANHNIGAPFEILALRDAWQKHFGPNVPVHGLAHRFVFRTPWLGTKLREAGFIPATYEDAYKSFDDGVSVAVFPGGDFEVTRPFWRRRVCDFNGRKGWARIARTKNVPVVPISIVDAHDVNPVLFQARFLSLLLVVPRLLGVKYFAITVSQLLYTPLFYFLFASFLPWWLTYALTYFIFLISIFFPCWPAQIRILINDPIDLNEISIGTNDESEALAKCYAHVVSKIQSGMDSL